MTLRASWSAAATAVAASVLAIALPVASVDAQAVFVARKVIGKVHHMAESQQTGRPGYDVATVLLDVPADRLFGFALERARHNGSVRIVMQDPAARRFEIAAGDRTATITVIAITDQVSHLVIAGTAGRD